MNDNTITIEIAPNWEASNELVSDFVTQTFGDYVGTEFDNEMALVVDFGYELANNIRDVGKLIYHKEKDVCAVIIKEFAAKRFFDFMKVWDVGYRILKD